MREHLERVRLFIRLASEQRETPEEFRLQLAAIYSCRGITELVLEAALKQELPCPDELHGITAEVEIKRWWREHWLVPRVRHHHLIERIRIHDFHRSGLIPPGPDQQVMFLGGPVRMTAQAGTAALYLSAQGAEPMVSGDSAVDLESKRPLEVRDGYFRDDDGQWKRLNEILVAFLEDAPSVITEVEALVQ